MSASADTMTTEERTPAEYLALARRLQETRREPALRLAVVASFSAEFLHPYLVVESSELECPAAVWCGPFGQFEALLVAEHTALWESRPDVVWIALRLEDAAPHLQLESVRLGADATRARLAAVTDRLVSLAAAARRHSRASLLVSNLAPSSLHSLRPFEASDPDGFGHLVAEANRRLARSLSEVADAHVFDYAGCVAARGAARWADARLWYLARYGASGATLPHLGRAVARAAAALVRPAAKCVVVDLDNTLWGGVLGDDGLEGIRLGDDYPGSAFKELQAALRGLRDRGFLLAVASKNDEALAREALDRHPEMLLRTKDFACLRINWEPKPVNLRGIAAELNLGLDALLFVDDNPGERAAVRAELPMVRVLELPAEPAWYVRALDDCAALDRPRLLDEDRQRGEMYAQEQRRREVLEQTPSLADALRDLRMSAAVGTATPPTLERIHQLIQKTNQFNLTTRRHRLEEIKRLAAAEDSRVAWLRLEDRYGQLGLVCVGIVRRRDPESWVIDTLLMSCRVMGRQVEAAFLSYLAELCAAAGARRLVGEYLPTPRNGPVRDFFPRHGFTPTGHCGDGARTYELALVPGALPWPDVIARRADAQREGDGAPTRDE
jgi:FkbH-like protein